MFPVAVFNTVESFRFMLQVQLGDNLVMTLFAGRRYDDFIAKFLSPECECMLR